MFDNYLDLLSKMTNIPKEKFEGLFAGELRMDDEEWKRKVALTLTVIQGELSELNKKVETIKEHILNSNIIKYP